MCQRDKMNDLDALLTDQIPRFEADLPADADLPLGSGMSCGFEATLLEPDPGTEGPTVTAHAQHISRRVVSTLIRATGIYNTVDRRDDRLAG